MNVKRLIPLATATSVILAGCSSSSTPVTAETDKAKMPDTTIPVDTGTKTPVGTGTKTPVGTETPAAPAAPTLSLSFAVTKAFLFTWETVPGATSYKLTEAVTNGSGYELVKEVTSTSFDHIVPLYARLNAKYILESCNAGGCTASAPVLTMPVVADMASSIGYFKADNTDAFDRFGYSVSLSEDGTTLAVGAPDEDSSLMGVVENNNAGAVYVFTRINNTSAAWSQQTSLRASNAGLNDHFGFSVSLSANGNTLAVGATGEGGAGAAYVFTRTDAESGAVWAEEPLLRAGHADAGDKFGYSVSLSADGNTLAVGATEEDSNATGVGEDPGTNVSSDLNNSGAVYVFTRSDEGWAGPAYLKALNTGETDSFGFSVSLNTDGSTLVVGAPYENGTSQVADENSNGVNNAGAAYVFTLGATGWSQQAYLKADNADEADLFGYSVSLSADGNTIAVGARYESSSAIGVDGTNTHNDAELSGAVYVFIHVNTKWSQQAYLKASNTGGGDRFGQSVSLSDDGNVLAVGAFEEDGDATGITGIQTDSEVEDSGAVYTFTRSGATWSPQAYIKASNTGAEDEFGRSVALSADGGTLAVGANTEGSLLMGVNPADQENDASTDFINSGAVYVY